jgi:hypothetical protein
MAWTASTSAARALRASVLFMSFYLRIFSDKASFLVDMSVSNDYLAAAFHRKEIEP